MTTSHGLRRLIGRLLRYGAVSVIATSTSLVILTGLVASGAARPAPANLVATAVATVPSFELNRRWVWGGSGRPSVRRQVVPFVALTLTGLLLSTIAVDIVGRLANEQGWSHGTTALAAAAASVGAFGLVWIVQFVLLDRLLFRPVPAAAHAGSPNQGAARPRG